MKILLAAHGGAAVILEQYQEIAAYDGNNHLPFLLGIQLMPRIRNWKDYTFVRPSEIAVYESIDPLFTEVVDCNSSDSFLREKTGF